MKTKTKSDLKYWGSVECPTPPSGMRVVFWIIVAIGILLAIAIGIRPAMGRPVTINWTFPTNTDLSQLQGVETYWAQTNNPTALTPIGFVGIGSLYLNTDSTNFQGINPVLLYGQTAATNGAFSAMSLGGLLDTNQFTVNMTNWVVVMVTNPPPVIPAPINVSASMPMLTNLTTVVTTNHVNQ